VEKGFVPARNHFAGADAKLQRSVLEAGAVEDVAVEKTAFVTNEDFLPHGGERSATGLARDIDQTGLLLMGARELPGDDQPILGAKLEDAVVLHGEAHRAVDGAAGVFSGHDPRAHDEGESEQTEPDEDENYKCAHGV